MSKLKYVDDYIDKVKERFPDLETWELEKILNHGFRSFYNLNKDGADVIIRSPFGLVMYFGRLFNNKESYHKYWRLKWRIKLRIKYRFNKTIWDGNYYFGLSKEDYKKYIPKKSGRLKNKITFDSIWLYKIKEEPMLGYECDYFFKLTGNKDEGISVHKENYSTRNIELIAVRDGDGKIKEI